MRIVTIVRTRNEERNIARFCRSYDWVDRIIVADGGSLDATKTIAWNFPNTVVHDYRERVYGNNGVWRNPEGRHINYLIELAKADGADWIILDDCDSFPSRDLRNQGRAIFEFAETQQKQGVKAFHIYLYGKDQWFPKPMTDGKFIWAWKPEANLSALATEDWGIILNNVPTNCLELDTPFSLIHDFCPTPEITKAKVDFYNSSGMMTPVSITEIFGELSPREEWMDE